MIRDFYFDRVLVICFLVLIILGVIFVFSATSTPSLINHKDPYFYLKREVMWAALSITVMALSYLVPIDFWKKAGYPIMILSIILLVLVFIFPAEIRGVHVKRWIDLGIVRFQPSEFVKLSTLIFVASYISRKEMTNGFLNSWSFIIGVSSLPAIAIVLVLIEPHKGAAILIAVLLFAVLVSSKVPARKLLLLPAVLIPMFLLFILSSDYALKRVEALIDPVHNRTGISYQVFQSILAFVKGGITGEGIGGGTQKLKYLPEIHTDFIFALVGEETGFIGAVAVIVIFLVILYRGIKISSELDDTFSQILGAGITYMIVIQAFFHMAVNVSLFPPTGFTLPFISYGGSSLIVFSIAAGILLRLSKEPKSSIYSRWKL
ncbi:putative lipid II flippase FtsW [Persephonella atlantica]|uniref:Probable peptidoglycan glycosyltransferase FtsW n=1 Tax=Persephonella atlantica TaxID=2699429 RepID=A0ABS1GF09_9AQUI|nr:putative lipid II flippase FtsW [Persephonella atlantica]MBK3331515.1 putative lipid II flippase FtsW [Persephonella atlantica]